MATDNWQIPEADAAEQAAQVGPEEETEAQPPEVTDADEADTLEQARELPEADEYRDT